MKQLGSGGSRQFMSVPIALQLTQPIFGVNNLKWNRRIEPVRYEEAKAAFITATETVTMNAITYFFNLLSPKETLGTARQNQVNADRLYEVAGAKRKMGQISENELLQLKLAALKARAAVTDAESNLNAHMFRLRSFLAIGNDLILEPVVPESAPNLKMEYNQVLNKALERNSFAHNIRRRQLEAEYEVATARGNLRSVDLFANVGYTGLNKDLSPAYHNLLDNQVVEVGVKIPILDWGKRRGKVRVAKSNRDVTLSKIKKEQMDFDQDIFLLVEHFRFSVNTVSVLFMINYAINWFLNPLIGRTINRIGERKLLSIEYSTAILVFTGYATTGSAWVAGVLYVIDYIVFNFSIALRTFFQKIAEPQDIAPTMAVAQTINHVAAIFVPALGGWLWVEFGYQIPFFIGAALSGCSLLLVQIIDREIRLHAPAKA